MKNNPLASIAIGLGFLALMGLMVLTIVSLKATYGKGAHDGNNRFDFNKKAKECRANKKLSENPNALDPEKPAAAGAGAGAGADADAGAGAGAPNPDAKLKAGDVSEVDDTKIKL